MRSLADRFAEKFTPEPMSGCWLWTASLSPYGYGEINGSRRRGALKAHRVSWEIHRGPIPVGLHVLHHCDNTACVNPDHLFIGTHADNMRDRDHKVRQPRGEAHGHSLLLKEHIAPIIMTKRAGVSAPTLAKWFGVSRACIDHVVSRRRWGHVQILA